MKYKRKVMGKAQIICTHECQKEEEISTLHSFVEEMQPLIPTLKKIVEAEEAKTWLSIRVANFLKIVGIIIGVLASLFGICYTIYKEIKK